MSSDETVKRKHAGFCVRYLRVSHARQTHTDADIVEDGNSIDTQRKLCAANEQRLGLVCIAEYVEPGTSAQSIKKRKEFKKVLRRFHEQHDATFLSIYMRSRAFRDYIEAGQTERELAASGVKMVSAKEDFGDDLNGQLMKAITDVVNWYEVRRNGEDVKTKMANKVMNGGTPSRAKLGYSNVSAEIDFHRVNTVEVDRLRMPLVLKAFELFATGKYVIDSLREDLTDAGLRTRPTKRFPTGNPISSEHLRRLLRDRYYIGWVAFKGVEYKGRHETFIHEDLFERVQRVLDSHQGAGTRSRKHNHYLKGWLWCNRCGSRFVIQRAMGNGGEYFYFFCTGRAHGTCDHPYVPVEAMEKAIVRYYETDVDFPSDLLRDIRTMVDAAIEDEAGRNPEVRQQLNAQIAALVKKEHYYLDLAAEEGWPKDILREKLTAIRDKVGDIERSLAEAESHLETGRQVFYRALDMLHIPARAYTAGDEDVKAVLNRVIFTKFMIDGQKVVDADFHQPFDELKTAYESYHRPIQVCTASDDRGADDVEHPADTPDAQRQDSGAAPAENENPVLIENGVDREVSLVDLLEPRPTFSVSGSNKTIMVGDTGFEPVTSSVSSAILIQIHV